MTQPLTAAQQAVKDADDEAADSGNPKRMLRTAQQHDFIEEIEYATGNDSEWCQDYVDAYIEYLSQLVGDS